ncbi:MAG: metabolite traffic protein EboE [Acidothermales bacterium]|nr:metabolite traffic protein EboE [Acidothermales bacterium]
MRHPDGTLVHLAYCTNVHTAEDLDGVLAQLGRYAGPVRERLGVPTLGVGLWLARDVATTLVDDAAALDRLGDELAACGLEVVTLNGFPYRGFGCDVVKRKVYTPDWSDPARLAYTLDLARVLARLLPDDVTGGTVSTLPLGWRTPWFHDRQEAAAVQLATLAEELAKLDATTGRAVRVGFEPEPGCVVETTDDAAAQLDGVDGDWLGVCLDSCHLAVAHEDPDAALARLDAAGLPVVKLQASCALEAADPGDAQTREALAGFAEPRFLHQTREPAAAGLRSVDDLDEALWGRRALPGHRPWRIHFHVPLHADPVPPLTSTRDVLTATLRALLGGPAARVEHVEVETYTWDVLPGGRRTDDDLVDGIAAELDWTRRQLRDLGLSEVAS